ncbi:hypothetical protein [Desulfofustis glycolicus]|uniref:Uncharacterized protein n=1 Tax=Desulfofustis glycolicus DSM 9705 TaxID=1121409 RepID=A0A1M5VIL4_9BACT|nr:hypothetical protein [Desulfofustis glycolicus]MCB2217613.1 hypothetical protein [Desulfobulbaceae bacterium]SHH75040.1 hypothetical protein SAMN02745124_01721 [Desulfofustis glycolicus DSM 9705]
MTDTSDNAFAIGRKAAYAVHLIRNHTVVLWFLGFLSLANATIPLFRDSALFMPATTVMVVLSIVATPVIYGLFYQLIDGSSASFHSLAKTYIAPYLWLLLRMYLPAILLASLPAIMFAEHGSGGYLEIGLIAFSMLYLYVIPCFYLSGRQHGAIVRGISFLTRHLTASTPLLLTVLLLESALLLVHYARTALAGQAVLLLAGVDFFVFLTASLVDLAVFIILVQILKNANLHDQ